MTTKTQLLRYTSIISLGLAFALPDTGFSSETVQKLPDAVVKATGDHPSILADKAAKEAAEHNVDFATGGYYPTLDFQMGAGHEYTKQKFRENQINRSKVSGTFATDRYDPTLRLRQMVFDGLETPYQVEKAEKERTQADLKTHETEELTAFAAAEQYIAVRRFGRLLRLAEDNVRVHRNILSKVNALISAGKATVSDRHNVEARLHDAQAAVQDIQGDLDSAIAQFIDVVGSEPGRLSNAELPTESLPLSVEDALDVARESNPSLMLSKASIDVAQADVNVAKSPFYPRLDLEVDASRRHNIGGKSGSENNLTALAVVRFNLFNGGKDQARTRELRAKMTQAKHLMQNQKRTAEREVRVSWSEMKSARGQADVLRKAVHSKKHVRNNYLEQFNLGNISFLNILDASHEYFLAKGSLITADATYDLASVRALAAMGVLKKTTMDLL
jgi:adhesin transport system outer membrane protein